MWVIKKVFTISVQWDVTQQEGARWGVPGSWGLLESYPGKEATGEGLYSREAPGKDITEDPMIYDEVICWRRVAVS